jgi:LysR family transcriptional regulator, flagellar master operon regulator
LDLTGLQTFLAIVDTGSLVRASERLHLGQSTVTTRLQRLEEELGQVLFHRSKSGGKLTPAGIKFKHYAEAITDLWQVARQETSLPEGIKTIFNLGCELDLWSSTGLSLIQKIRDDYPDTGMSAWPAKQYELDQWLESGMINAALSYQPIALDNCTSHNITTDTLVLVSTHSDKQEQNDPEFIYVYAGDDMGRRHIAAYADAGQSTISFGCTTWALDFLLAQGGSVFLPQRLADSYCQSGNIQRVSDVPVIERQIYLITNDKTSINWPWLDTIIDWLNCNFNQPL